MGDPAFGASSVKARLSFSAGDLGQEISLAAIPELCQRWMANLRRPLIS
jgi:hypothetical protein